MKSYRRGDLFLEVEKVSVGYRVSIEIHKQVYSFSGSMSEIYAWALGFSRSIADFVIECVKKSDTI